jgi:hypothetical protein
MPSAQPSKKEHVILTLSTAAKVGHTASRSMLEVIGGALILEFEVLQDENARLRRLLRAAKKKVR